MSNDLTITKVAYVNGMSETLGGMGLARWPSGEAYERGVVKVASLLEFDPGDTEVGVKTAGYICDAIIKIAKEECDEAEADDDDDEEINKNRMDALNGADEATDEEKTSTVNYWALCDAARDGAKKFAAAMAGMNPGQNVTGNTLSEAQAHDSLAQIELRRRPHGYAESAPDDRSVGGQIGSQQRHPGADNIGRTNGSGGFQPSRDGKVAQDIWASLKAAANEPTGAAENGMNPGQSNMTGNTLSDAEAHDSLAQIEKRRRPDGYAETPPKDSSVGGAIGSQQWHPNASNVGKSNSSVGSGQQVVSPKEKAAMYNDPELANLPDGLIEKAFVKKAAAKTIEQKKALFQQAVADLAAHRLYDRINSEAKVAFCKETMYLDTPERMAFFSELDRKLN